VHLGSVKVYHLDLGRHDVVIAEGATLESYGGGHEHFALCHCRAAGRYPEAPEVVIRRRLAMI
jgi:hypothetical protein